MNRYDDIINLDHFEPKHKRMSIYERAAQFAPFAALTGYSDEIKEVSRYTESESLIDDNCQEIINFKLEVIKEHIETKPKVKLIYFVPDKSKSGGKLMKYTGNLEKIDSIEKKLVFSNKEEIYFKYINDIDSEVLSTY